MKGIVFTEFIEMVEKSFGYETVDEMLVSCDLPSKGVYTAVGTYEYDEMLQLVGFLHKKTKLPVPDLLKTFGQYLFGTFEKNYGVFFDKEDNAFDFFESIENHIHVEVKKLYPDAQLPTFDTTRISDNILEMVYKSERKMADFAMGLIEKTLIRYNERARISRENIEEDGSIVRFLIEKY